MNQFDRDKFIKTIAGAVRATIHDHGDITPDWIGSAAKRIAGQLIGQYCRLQCPCSKHAESIISRLPIYADTGEHFIPGRDVAWVIVGSYVRELSEADYEEDYEDSEDSEGLPIWVKCSQGWAFFANAEYEGVDEALPLAFSTSDAAKEYQASNRDEHN